MVSPEDVRRLALALPGAAENAHMGQPDFRVRNKIFASLPPGGEAVVVKFAPDHQAGLVAAEPGLFEPVPGGWGRQGWTRVSLRQADEETVKGVLLTAWRTVAPASVVRGRAHSAGD